VQTSEHVMHHEPSAEIEAIVERDTQACRR
jgi:hypothetical protein